ncbi:MAG: nucleotidyltransferase family protein [Planctomycetota bacterium]
MLTAAEIVATCRAHRDRLRELGVRRLGLFGSFARGEAGPESDLDFVIELDARTFDRFMDAKLFLEDLFDRAVDLVPFDRIKPRLRERILAEVVDAA